MNQVAVDINTIAFHSGRCLAKNPSETEKPLGIATPPKTILDEIVDINRTFLRAYQDDTLAMRYCQRINQLSTRNKNQMNHQKVTTVVAKDYAHLLDIKDEYEVARILTSKEFKN